MKKTLALLLTALLILTCSACNSNNGPLSAIEGASSEQLSAIQKILDDNSITVKTCKKGTIESTGDDIADSVANALAESYEPYDLVDESGAEYRMTIKKDDKSIIALVDSEGNFVYGGISGLFN